MNCDSCEITDYWINFISIFVEIPYRIIIIIIMKKRNNNNEQNYVTKLTAYFNMPTSRKCKRVYEWMQAFIWQCFLRRKNGWGDSKNRWDILFLKYWIHQRFSHIHANIHHSIWTLINKLCLMDFFQRHKRRHRYFCFTFFIFLTIYRISFCFFTILLLRSFCCFFSYFLSLHSLLAITAYVRWKHV